MKEYLKGIGLLVFLLCGMSGSAQKVTKTSHKGAVRTDVVTTGTMTIRKPDYICIDTDGGREQLVMDGTKFTMKMGGRQHVTDSRKNELFATFHSVLKAIINAQSIPQSDEVAVVTKGESTHITIKPPGKRKRQLFTSFALTIDAKTKTLRMLRMNGRGEDYTEYIFK